MSEQTIETTRAGYLEEWREQMSRHYLLELEQAYGITRLRREIAALAARKLPDTARAVRRFLRDDLAEFPASFRRVSEPWIKTSTRTDAKAREARDHFREFREREELPTRTLNAARGGCACGCRGSNDRLAQLLSEIRASARLPGSFARQESLTGAKRDLVVALWIAGASKVDRLQLSQHAVDSAKHEIEELETRVVGREKSIALRLLYLERDRVKGGPRKGQPLEAEDREKLTDEIAEWEAVVTRHRARGAHLSRLLASDVPQLVREFTGCAREHRGTVSP